MRIHESVSRKKRDVLLRGAVKEGVIPPRFLYETDTQGRLWRKIHQKYSPMARGGDAPWVYQQAFAFVADLFAGQELEVLSVGCGDGGKDAIFLKYLAGKGCRIRYIPCDISRVLVEAAARAGRKAAGSAVKIFPLICDVGNMKSWKAVARSKGRVRVVLFLGMIPNLAVGQTRKILKGLLRREDPLIFSANLLPHDRVLQSRILPQYDNPETRRWVQGFMEVLRLSPRVIDVRFQVGHDPRAFSWKRLEAWGEFLEDVQVKIAGANDRVAKGRKWLMFFSNRPKVNQLGRVILPGGWKITRKWVSDSGEEGVFLGKAS